MCQNTLTGPVNPSVNNQDVYRGAANCLAFPKPETEDECQIWIKQLNSCTAG